MVGVEIRTACHGQHRPGLGVDHQPEGPVLHVVGLDALLQGLLQHGLDPLVQGEGQVTAVLRVEIHLVPGDHLHARAVFGGHHPAQIPGQGVLIHRLDALRAHLPVAAVLVLGQITQHVGAHRREGVVPLAGRRGVEQAGDPVFGGEGPHLFRVLLLHLLLQLDPGVAGLFHLLPEPVLVIAEGVHQPVHDELPPVVEGLLVGVLVQLILLALEVLLDRIDQVQGGQDQLVDRGGHGHDAALPVVDHAPVGVDRDALGLLNGGLLLPFGVLHDLELVELPHQGDEQADPQSQHQHDGPPEQAAVAPPLAAPAGGSFGFLHGILPPRMLERGARESYIPRAPVSLSMASVCAAPPCL